MSEELMLVGIIFLAWGGSMLALIYISKLFNYKKWNKGFHKNCNSRWIYDFTDSQGNHCYHCQSCRKPMDIGWNFKV